MTGGAGYFIALETAADAAWRTAMRDRAASSLGTTIARAATTLPAGSRTGTAMPVASGWRWPARNAYPCRRTSAKADLNCEDVLIVFSVKTSSGRAMMRSCCDGGA